MRLRGLQQGDLAKWLQVIAAAQETTPAGGLSVPPAFVEHLLLLRCIEHDAHGALRITDKGRLALHMERSQPKTTA